MVANRAMTLPELVLPTSPEIGLDEARSHIEDVALRPSTIGTVGLELEFHLVDLRCPVQRVEWPRVAALLASVPELPGGSRLTVEPGGQVELSSPPAPDVRSSIALLRRDRAILGAFAADAGFGLAGLGADPARPSRRVNPGSRYVAMERYFDAAGFGHQGRAMMGSTAALQVNLEAGPANAWPQRLAHIHRLAPVLGAMSACSPLLAGRASGWASMRQQVWSSLDPGRCRPLAPGDRPASAWADYAMSATVMLTRDGPDAPAVPVLGQVTLEQWLSGAILAGRAPGLEDLDYHLSTLFPPVRPRGYLEIRCVDAVPDRWWPALAAITVTLIDDPVAADAAAEACAPVSDAWRLAARSGLNDRVVARAARRCVEIAAQHCPRELRGDVEAYADLVSAGRTPGDHLREVAAARGPLAVLEEEARA